MAGCDFDAGEVRAVGECVSDDIAVASYEEAGVEVAVGLAVVDGVVDTSHVDGNTAVADGGDVIECTEIAGKEDSLSLAGVGIYIC